MTDIDTAVVDSLKVLDPNRPIREADNGGLWSAMVYPLMTHQRHGAVWPDCYYHQN